MSGVSFYVIKSYRWKVENSISFLSFFAVIAGVGRDFGSSLVGIWYMAHGKFYRNCSPEKYKVENGTVGSFFTYIWELKFDSNLNIYGMRRFLIHTPHFLRYLIPQIWKVT